MGAGRQVPLTARACRPARRRRVGHPLSIVTDTSADSTSPPGMGAGQTAEYRRPCRTAGATASAAAASRAAEPALTRCLSGRDYQPGRITESPEENDGRIATDRAGTPAAPMDTAADGALATGHGPYG